MIIAIHPDDYTNPQNPHKEDASSPKWAKYIEEKGHQVKWVDVTHSDILSNLQGCDGFMWRWAHFGGMGRVARRLLPVIERYLNVPVYPNQTTCWHYDDKIAQSYLFQALGIPSPKTWVWFDPSAAKVWAEDAVYPLVLKLATGAGATNVKLVENIGEAFEWIDILFSRRLSSFCEAQFQPLGALNLFKSVARSMVDRAPPIFKDDGYDVQSGYAYFQEFLPGNVFDTRVVVIGPRAFAFRRFNRENDFRASGSGKIDHDPRSIDLDFVSLAFKVAKDLEAQSCAIDGLYKDGKPVVGEVSYTYASWAVKLCPGHWDKDLNWHPGEMWPEEAQIKDFLRYLEQRGKV